MVRLVSVPDSGSELTRRIAEVQTALPEWRADPSSPIWYALEQRVVDLVSELSQLNESGQALVVGDAQGDDLDQLLANFAMTRQTDETDAAFRARVPEQWAQLANDTEPGVLRRVSAISGVADATLARGANYVVTLYLQGTGYTAPTEPLRTAVLAAMNAADAKPWYTDFQVATLAQHLRTDYSVVGTVGLEDNSSVNQGLVRAALTEQALSDRRLGRTIYLSQYTAAAQGAGGAVYANLAFAAPNAAASSLAGAVGTVWVGSAAAAGSDPAANLVFVEA